MDQRELEDLGNLVKHPGYLRFLQHVKAEVKHMMGAQLEAVANDANDANAAGKLRQIIASKQQLERIFQWPYERVAFLEQQMKKAEPTQTRGGA